MNLSIGKKIGIGIGVALIALLIIGVVTSLDLQELNSDAGWVTHTVEVEHQVSVLESALIEAESSARGFVLLPDPTFKSSFKQGSLDAQAAYNRLRSLTSDNPNQQQRLDHLQASMNARLKDLDDLMNLSASASTQQRSDIVQQGADAMAETRQLLQDMMDEENRLLKDRQSRASSMAHLTSATIIGGTLVAFVIVGLVGLAVTRSITIPIRILGEGATVIGSGRYAHRVQVNSADEVGTLASLFNRMAEQVQERQQRQVADDWLKTSLALFTALFQGQRDETALCRDVLSELADLLHIHHGVIYTADLATAPAALRYRAGYAVDPTRPVVQAGEGLAGQCFADKRRLTLDAVPEDYFKISSALGATRPRALVLQPALYEGEVKAVLELALLAPLTPLQLAFLDQLASSLGVVLNTIAAGMRTEELLRQSQALSADLQKSEILLKEQQEELKQTNEELEQTNEELQQANEEMEEKVNLLAEQKRQMEKTNREIEQAREELESRAAQIAQGSRYKSQFLANMSHELRTPLNSLLILSKILADNPEDNLKPKQVEYAQTIYSSGNDLLELINEVLDLAKIESGAVEYDPQPAAFAELRSFVESTFQPMAESRRLELKVELDRGLPSTISTDIRRLEQIIKNLISNALKFTERGSVILRIAPVTTGWDRPCAALDDQEQVVAFAVVDTGVGVAPHKRSLIFEAFQQGDAGTARKYGGTGLGLSISRELAHLLGGTLQLTSSSEMGSTFTLYLPVQKRKSLEPAPTQPGSATTALRSAPPSSSQVRPPVLSPGEIEDDRGSLAPGDHILLIVDDDRNFAGIARNLARERRFKVVTAQNARNGLELARQLKPSAILLDLHLPDNDGWVVLDRLKHDPAMRHIPIHIISIEPERERSLRQGALSYLQKPVTKEALDAALNQTIDMLERPLKNLLIIEDDPVQRQALVDLIGNGDVKSTAAASAAEAFAAMDNMHFDCIVVDLGLPDTNGTQLIRDIHRKLGPVSPPIIVYTGKELTRQEETELRLISDSIVVKSVRSPERLLDETALFLHRVQTKLPESKQRMIELVQKADSLLAGRKVLVVDDDVRNIFAITSALEAYQMKVSYAESGQGALDILAGDPGIEIVLMDVMMPEMDGYETIRRIRRMEGVRHLPIISVTAKAMKDDREKCLQAGASDYITKPVDMDQLRSLMRVWLYR
jgi:hypothetical protein